MPSKLLQLWLGLKGFSATLLVTSLAGIPLAWLLGVTTDEFLRMSFSTILPIALLNGWLGRKGRPKRLANEKPDETLRRRFHEDWQADAAARDMLFNREAQLACDQVARGRLREQLGKL